MGGSLAMMLRILRCRSRASSLHASARSGVVGGEIVECFWDIESARKPLSERGQGAVRGRGRVGVPREGGLPELLAATLRGRAFCAVIVESIDRVSRITADATRIEQELEQRDIGLFAADEPMCASATALLTRRVKQGVAEWYVRDLLEHSHRGMQESARQGWHTGGLRRAVRAREHELAGASRSPRPRPGGLFAPG
jgi:DNA invertase Pin-like site-specific DNA recombinase